MSRARKDYEEWKNSDHRSVPIHISGKLISELEQQNAEMLEALIDAYLIFDGLNFDGIDNIKNTIESATGKSIEEVLK